MKKLNRNIEIILALTLIIYIPLFVSSIFLKNSSMPFIGADAIEYKTLSESVINNHDYTQDGIHPEIFRSPGYPVFLAITKNIFGTYWFSIFFQILCTLGISILIYKISTKVFNEKIGLLSGILWLIEPSVVIYTLTISSDIPFVFLFILSIYYLFFQKTYWVNTSLAGIFLALATYMRPISMYFIFISVIFFIFIKYKNIERKVLIRNILIYAFAFILVLTPWLVRNYNYFEKITLSSLAGFNMFHYNIPEYESFRNNTTAEVERGKIREKLGEDIQNDTDLRRGEFMDELGKFSKEYLKENFFGYATFHILKTAPFFISSSVKNARVMADSILNIESDVQYNNLSSMILKADFVGVAKVIRSEWLSFLERLIWLILVLLSIVSIFDKGDRERWKFSLFLLVTIFYFALLTGPVSYVRYRLPAEPFIFMTAIYGIYFTRQKINKESRL